MGRERDGADDMRENCDNATKEPEVEERQENRHPAYVRFGREGRKRNR